MDWKLGQNNNPSVEVDIYGGKHTDVMGIDWNIMPYYYAYPGFNAFGGPTADYFELINQLTKSFNGVTLQATYAWSLRSSAWAAAPAIMSPAWRPSPSSTG